MNNHENKRAGGESATLREKIRKAAESLKDKAERAKNMSEENKVTQEQETEAAEQVVDVEALQQELDKTKAQCDEYLDLAQRKQAEFANYRRRTEGVRQEAFDAGAGDGSDRAGCGCGCAPAGTG